MIIKEKLMKKIFCVYKRKNSFTHLKALLRKRCEGSTAGMIVEGYVFDLSNNLLS